MRLLANENVPLELIVALRAHFDVAWVREEAPGLVDPGILAWATRDARVLISFDKDFGELAFRSRLPARSGVILLRVPPPRSAERAAPIAALIIGRTDWVGQFSVVEVGRVRMRPLPERN